MCHCAPNLINDQQWRLSESSDEPLVEMPYGVNIKLYLNKVVDLFGLIYDFIFIQ